MATSGQGICIVVSYPSTLQSMLLHKTEFKKYSSCIIVTIDTRNSLRDNIKQDKDSNSVEHLLLNKSGCNFSFKPQPHRYKI